MSADTGPGPGSQAEKARLSGPAAWWRSERHADRRPFLEARTRVRRAVRRWFEARGFVEVECGALAVSPCAETHLHGFATTLREAGGEARTLYLHTSPEMSAKKLLAAGERRIFEMARVWRNGEAGPLHAPEFTMLEWYRAEEPYEAVIADTIALIRTAAEAAGAPRLRFRGSQADPFAEPVRITAEEAFARFAGVELLRTVAPGGETDRDDLAAQARAAGVRVDSGDTWSDVFTRLMAERIEPRLDASRVTIFDGYPAPEAALARVSARDPRVAERFEAYACGVELANGFGELTDADEQRRRYVAAMEAKARVYGESYPIDEDFIEALRIMPDAAGVAMGFDRLVMLCADARTIDDVIWTPLPGRRA